MENVDKFHDRHLVHSIRLLSAGVDAKFVQEGDLKKKSKLLHMTKDLGLLTSALATANFIYPTVSLYFWGGPMRAGVEI